MMEWLWQFIAGCVKIKVEGLKLIALLNEAAVQGISLRNARRLSYSRMEAQVSWQDYRKLCVLAQNRPLRIIVLSKWGLPTVFHRALKRPAFVAGLLLCIAALIAVNQFVLEVQVEGCTEQVLAERVEAFVAEQGVVPGAGKWLLNLPRTQRMLLLHFPELTFAAIHVRGVRATVQVAEGDPQPVLIDKDKPCDIVAGRAAVVRSLTVYEGRAIAKPGDVVRAGQPLVSGALEPLEEDIRLVHARADVWASVWYEGRGSAPLYDEQSIPTGRVSQRWQLSVGPYTVLLSGQDSPYPRYDTQVREYYLLGRSHKGPKIVLTEYLDAFRLTQERDYQVVKTQALERAAEVLARTLPIDVKVVERRVEYGVKGKVLTARIYIETLQNIAQEAPLR